MVNALADEPDEKVWPAHEWVRTESASDTGTYPILVAAPVADFIRQVHERRRAEIRWHTSWQQHANAVGQLVGLPELPVAVAPEWAAHRRGERTEWWKIGAARRVVQQERRPLLWADDDAAHWWNLPREVRRELAAAQPTLVVSPPSLVGLGPEQLSDIDDFLTAVTTRILPR